MIRSESVLADGGALRAQGVELRVLDADTADGSSRVYNVDLRREGAAQAGGAAGYAGRSFSATHRMPLYGRTWTTSLSTLAAFDAARDRSGVWITGAVGTIGSALFTALVWLLATLRARAVALAESMAVSLRRTEETNRRIVETALDAIVSMDAADRITGWNPRAESMFGRPRDEALGRTVAETIVPERLRETHNLGFAQFLATGKSALLGTVTETSVLGRDGSEIAVEMAITSIHDGAGTSFAAFIRDISERKRAEATVQGYLVEVERAHQALGQQARALAKQATELAEARDAAEAANRAKSDFLATMSHEIRTPMNGVLGMTTLLLDTPLTAEQRDFATAIQTSGDALLTLINDILDFSKIEAGRMSFEPIRFDLRVVLEEVVELLAPRALEKDVEIVLRYPPSSATRFVADPGRIRQVAMNLASNAVKFSHHGHVLIDVDLVSVAAEEALVRIRVVDEGIGIPADKIPLLFQRFSQADSSTTRRFGGTGLGLAISRRIVEMMGGEVSVESRAGEGSTFAFTMRLPLDPEPAPVGVPRAQIDGVRCIIVDDVPINRRIVEELTASWGMRPTAAESAANAMQLMREAADAGDPFEVGLLDLRMPDVDGEELARAIRADARLSGTLLVLLTSASERGLAARFTEAGFHGFLAKPFRASDLHDLLATIWSQRATSLPNQLVTRHSIADARASEIVTPAAATSAAALPRSGLRVLVAEDNPVNQKVAVRMLQKLACSVDVAANGVEAVDMATRFPYDVVFMDCHMPEMDGYAATRAIREALRAERRPTIIAMTANAMAGDRETCLAAGMDDYVTKPVRIDAVRAALANACPADAAAADAAAV